MITEIKNFFAFNFFNKNKFIEDGFLPFYHKNILPRLTEFEVQRKKLLNKFYFCIVLMGALLVLNFYLNHSEKEFLDKENLIDLAFYYIIGIFLIILLFYFPVRNYNKKIFEYIYPLVFQYFEGSFKYFSDEPIPISELLNYNILPNFNNWDFRNFVKGNYKGVQLKFWEARLTQTEVIRNSQNQNETKIHETFEGLFITLSMNKNFKGKTIVVKDKGIILNFLTKKFIKLQNVKLEDPLFEKYFEVYSSDQIEARYLLTTSFMDRLLKLSKIFNDAKIQCSFFKEKLFIIIPQKKTFLIPIIFKHTNLIPEINLIINEMRLVFAIVDELKLNSKLGL